MTEEVPGGIPADITAFLGEMLVTAALGDAFGGAATDAVSTFPGRGDDRRAITGDGEGRGIDEPFGGSMISQMERGRESGSG